jgi:uncharacterized lipoprotein YmbA
MLAACFTLTTLGACSIKSETAPSNFYMLNSMSTEAATGGAQSGLSDLELAIGPVSVPAYLDRPQIVTRGPGNEVTLSEFDRWAEPLKDNITSVLTDNLSRLLPTERVSVYPSSLARDLDLRVTLEVIRFDGSMGGDVVLDARWSVIPADAEAPLRTERSGITQPASDSGYAAVVNAMNRALDSLSREIAAGVRHAAGR